MASRQQILIRKLDKEFSKVIRERDKRCITCGKAGNLHAGHFRRRGFMATRFDPRNVAGQCPRDNVFLFGREYDFGIALDKKWGKGTAKELYLLSKESKQWSVKELEALLDALKTGGLKRYEELYFLTNNHSS